MDIKNFSSGKKIKQLEYESFLPEKINHEWIISSPDVNNLLAEANRFIGELNAYSQIIPDVDFFISMHILKEATTSSKIEGTKTSIEEALIKEEDISPEKRDDWAEVQNYVRAINQSINDLSRLPISNRLLKQTHKTLLSGVRGTHKLPGEFRRSQNWIGATLKDAMFVPPHHEDLHDLMGDLELFINNPDVKVPELIKIAIIHYQFETIHPFLDGNGRLGRLLISLYLVSRNILTKPALYISDFFERNRSYYYDNLMAARTAHQLEQWIKFFLVGVIETSKNSINVFKKELLNLRNRIELKALPKLGSKIQRGHQLLKILYLKPIIDAKSVSESLKISPATSGRLINQFMELGILKELTGHRRNRVFIFKDYVDIFHQSVQVLI